MRLVPTSVSHALPKMLMLNLMIKIRVFKHVCSSSLWSYPDPICAYNWGKCLLTYSDKIEFLLLTLLHRVPREVCHHIVGSCSGWGGQSLPVQHPLVHHPKPLVTSENVKHSVVNIQCSLHHTVLFRCHHQGWVCLWRVKIFWHWGRRLSMRRHCTMGLSSCKMGNREFESDYHHRPIFLKFSYFRQKYLEIASCAVSLLNNILVRVEHSLLQQLDLQKSQLQIKQSAGSAA